MTTVEPVPVAADRIAELTAERDALAAKLTEVRAALTVWKASPHALCISSLHRIRRIVGEQSS